MEAEKQNPDHIKIFVNRRPFDEGDGVTPEMTGRKLAGLVDVPADNAVVRFAEGDRREIGLDEVIHVHSGEHFLVTRKVVEGGDESRAN